MDLQLKNISHSYGPVEVLKDISLTIPQGQIVCLIGPSGCGKSTLLRFLGGLERPSSGEVLQIGSPPKDSLNPSPMFSSTLRCCHGAAWKEISSWCWRITVLAGQKWTGS